MIKVLIVCNNFEMSKRLINQILCNIENLKIVGIIDKINSKTNLENLNLVITNNQNLASNLQKNYNIMFISLSKRKVFNSKNIIEINYLDSDSNIYYSLNNFLKPHLINHSKNKISELLKVIGFNFKLSGTIYLIDAISYIYSFKLLSFENLHKDIYPYVAKLNNTSINRVKWSIERCIKYLYNKNEIQASNAIYNYFGIKYPTKITPKTLINLITNYLEKNY